MVSRAPHPKEQEMTLLDDMSGHPGMAAYRDNGYEIITF